MQKLRQRLREVLRRADGLAAMADWFQTLLSGIDIRQMIAVGLKWLRRKKSPKAGFFGACYVYFRPLARVICAQAAPENIASKELQVAHHLRRLPDA